MDPLLHSKSQNRSSERYEITELGIVLTNEDASRAYNIICEMRTALAAINLTWLIAIVSLSTTAAIHVETPLAKIIINQQICFASRSYCEFVASGRCLFCDLSYRSAEVWFRMRNIMFFDFSVKKTWNQLFRGRRDYVFENWIRAISVIGKNCSLTVKCIRLLFDWFDFDYSEKFLCRIVHLKRWNEIISVR